MRARQRVLVALVTGAGLCVAACGGDDATPTTAATPVAQSAAAAVAGDVTVFAAASLTDAFSEIGTAFEAAHPDVALTFSFAGSSDLVAQIDEGAPADVFASADQANMAALTAAAGQPVDFATNALEIITAPGNPEGIADVADLADSDLVVVACAPEVPCGRYADQLLDAAGVTVTPKSYEENVRGVTNKVTLGEADAGIVYRTDVLAAGDDASGVAIPADVNVVAEYPIVATTEAPNPEGAAAFIDFVLGPQGQAILGRHGFTGP